MTEAGSTAEQRLTIFQHHPKAGGTSLRAALMHQFPPEVTLNMRQVMDSARSHEQERRLARYHRYLETGFPSIPVIDAVDWKVRFIEALPMARRATYRLVLGHFDFGVHELFPRPSAYITLLRDPVDRVLSRGR